jgi:hypothetical protein
METSRFKASKLWKTHGCLSFDNLLLSSDLTIRNKLFELLKKDW